MEQLTQYLTILSLSEWLMISVVVVLVMSLFSFKRQRKQQELQSLSMQSLQRDLRALANAAVGVGGRVLEIERNQRKRPMIVETHEPQVNNFNATTPVEYYNSSNQQYSKLSYCRAVGLE